MRACSLRILTALLGVVCLLALPALLTGCKGCRKSPDRPADTVEPFTCEAEDTAHTSANGEYDPTRYVVIRTAEDLMAFNRAVNLDGYRFDGMTVVFLADVDVSDYTWTPLDGAKLAGVTFDGQGHTLSGIRFAHHEYPADEPPADADRGCGLVDVAEGDLLFRDLTLSQVRVSAYDHSVGGFVGSVKCGSVGFEGCRVTDFTVEGWMDWFHRDRNSGGHTVAMRVGGFVGYVGEGGRVRFDTCTAEGLTLSGFHNLAGFVGYDGSGELDASHFTSCAVMGAEITFSYCLAEAYTADQPQKFVSVFYNATDWVDSVTPCLAAGNRYADVTFYDWAEDSTAYTPDIFQSTISQEANHDK